MTQNKTLSRKLEESINVMVVDDDRIIRAMITKYLSREGYGVQDFDDGREAIESFIANPADIVILDLVMPSINGISVLNDIKKTAPSTEVVIITGNAEKESAIEALKKGAFDLLEKPFSMKELNATLKRTVRYQTVSRDKEKLEDQVTRISKRNADTWGIDKFIGQSKGIKNDVIKHIRLLQKQDLTSVLILGESGTGKELVARAIHFGSKRSTFPFVPVNCSAIPGTLAESILFGHTKGSFTGATTDKQGCFEQANGGTLFLDEIGDMPTDIQIKLLRVLEDKIVVAVGASKGVSVDTRVLAATNANLEAKVKSGAFREDLYYRLARYKILIPPLRDRMEDMPLLVEHFAKQLTEEMGIAESKINPDFVEELSKYDFPGNVRELRNITERALIIAAGAEVSCDHLHLGGIAVGSTSSSPQNLEIDSLPFNLEAAQKILVKRAIDKSSGNISKASKLLGISRAKIYRMINGE